MIKTTEKLVCDCCREQIKSGKNYFHFICRTEKNPIFVSEKIDICQACSRKSLEDIAEIISMLNQVVK